MVITVIKETLCKKNVSFLFYMSQICVNFAFQKIVK